MLKILKGILDTSEGWAALIGLVWAIAANIPGIPKTLDMGGYGALGPALFLAFGLPSTLAKLKRSDTIPFQPIGGANGTSKPGTTTIGLLVASSALLLGLAAPAMADDTPPLSTKRIGLSVGAGLSSYDRATEWGKASGMMHGALAYSTGKQLSIGSSARWDWEPDAWTVELGPRVLLVGDGTGDKAQMAVGANLVWYLGAGDLAYGLEDAAAWNAGIYTSYKLGQSGSLRWYVTGDAEHDPANSFTAFHLLGRVSGLWSDWF
jgi:hypothetical protein